MKIKSKQIYQHLASKELVRVSRVSKTQIFFYPYDGGGKEYAALRSLFTINYVKAVSS